MARIVPWEQSNDSTVTPIVSSRTDCRPVYRKNKVIEFIIHLSRVQVLSGAILWGKRYERDAETTCEMLTAVDKSLTICGSLIQETELLQTMWHYLAIKNTEIQPSRFAQYIHKWTKKWTQKFCVVYKQTKVYYMEKRRIHFRKMYFYFTLLIVDMFRSESRPSSGCLQEY